MKQIKDHFGGNGTRTREEQHAALKEKARVAGKSLGMMNMPDPKEESLKPYTKSIEAAYTSLLSQRAPSNESDVAEIEGRSSEDKAGRIDKRLADQKGKLKHAQLEMAELDDDDARHKNNFFIWAGIVLVALVESLFSYKAFSMLDIGNNLTLVVLLVALTAAFIMLPKALRWWHEEFTVESPYKAILNFVPVVVVGIGFFVLGLLRSKYLAAEAAMSLSNTSGSSSFIVSPFYFVGISVFLLLISYYLAHQLPSEKQRRNKAAIDKKEADISKYEAEIERLEAELSSIPDRQKNSLIRASHTNNSRREEYAKINSYYKEAIGIFIETNLTFRTDGQRPKCFDEPIDDLQEQII